MLRLKSCPKCRGDLDENKDIYGPYIHCLQCGQYMDIIEDKVPYGVPPQKSSER